MSPISKISGQWIFFLALLFVFSLLPACVIHAHAQKQTAYKIQMPYKIEIQKEVRKTSIRFVFTVSDIELEINSIQEFRDTDQKTVKQIGMIIGSVGTALPIFLINPDYLLKTVGKNKVSVTGAEIIARRKYPNQPVHLVVNGQDMGTFMTDENGVLEVEKAAGGVYSLVTNSEKEGLSLSRDFFVE
jgi:hypothetical protein